MMTDEVRVLHGIERAIIRIYHNATASDVHYAFGYIDCAYAMDTIDEDQHNNYFCRVRDAERAVITR